MSLVLQPIATVRRTSGVAGFFGVPVATSAAAVRLLVVAQLAFNRRATSGWASVQILHADVAAQMNSLLWICMRLHDAQKYAVGLGGR